MKQVQIQDALVEDTIRGSSSTAPPLYNITNMTMVPGEWKMPNSFTYLRSATRFFLNSTATFRWSLKLNQSLVKQFVRININIVNYTYLSPEDKQLLVLNISLDVGPNRVCALQKQTYEFWEYVGRRTDSMFVCDTPTEQAYWNDARHPLATMVFTTHVNLNVTYELIALLLGKAYGTWEEPLCGEPEASESMLLRPVRQFSNYTAQCNGNEDFVEKKVDSLTNGTLFPSSYSIQCGRDMKWTGEYPVCLPKKVCPLNELVREKVKDGMEESEDDSDKVLVHALEGVYFVDDQEYYAVNGSVAIYSCTNSSTDIMVGKGSRHCDGDGGLWSGSRPVCYSNKCLFNVLETCSHSLFPFSRSESIEIPIPHDHRNGHHSAHPPGALAHRRSLHGHHQAAQGEHFDRAGAS